MLSFSSGGWTRKDSEMFRRYGGQTGENSGEIWVELMPRLEDQRERLVDGGSEDVKLVGGREEDAGRGGQARDWLKKT